MKERDIWEKLQILGLNTDEAKAYTWLLAQTQSTGYELGKALGLPRGSAYNLMERLVRLGLARTVTQNRKKTFVPVGLKVWKEQLEEKNRALQEAMPGLEGLSALATHTTDIRVYKGVVGLQKAWDEVIEHFEKDNIKVCYAVSHASELYKTLPKYFRRWIERRVANKTEALLIYPLEDKPAVASGEIAEPRAQYKFVAGSNLAFKGDVTCGGRLTAIFSLDKQKEPQAVIIDSKDITNMFSQWFMTLWKVLP